MKVTKSFVNTKSNIKGYFLMVFGLFLLAGCSMDARLFNMNSQLDESEPQLLERTTPDYIGGEVVITQSGTAGYEVRAVMGEVSQKTQSLNGNQWQIEGVFYE